MQKTYTEKSQPVKSANENLRHSYPLLWGFRNFLFNFIPFVLVWLASDLCLFAAAFGTFLFFLIYALRQNYCRNRRLSKMAQEVKERGNA